MIITWNADKIISDLQKCYFACNDSRMDGFVTWGCKQDLYRVKFLVEQLLEKCPTYSVEAEWLREQEAEKIVRILKNEM